MRLVCIGLSVGLMISQSMHSLTSPRHRGYLKVYPGSYWANPDPEPNFNFDHVPNEEGIINDGVLAMKYLAKIYEHRIYVQGRSMGGAVATGIVQRLGKSFKIEGLILQNTFTSVRGILPFH
jgi:pimeloyl-ACP methyl ester carboxylesterase